MLNTAMLPAFERINILTLSNFRDLLNNVLIHNFGSRKYIDTEIMYR